MNQQLNKMMWREAATGGLILGLGFCATMVISYLLKNDASNHWVGSFLQFSVIVGTAFFYTRKVSLEFGGLGFTYGQGIGFILRLMIFAGILCGIGAFILHNYVDPEYYLEQTQIGMLNLGISEAQVKLAMENAWALKNPLLLVFSGMLNMLLYGGVVGIFIAAFTKRPVDPLANTPKQDEFPSANV